MKNLINNFYLIILIVFSIFISSISWKFIEINFAGVDIVGEYLINKHHALNDPLRYLIFILIPTSTYCLYSIFFKKRYFNFENIKFQNVNAIKNFDKLFIFCLIIISFILLEFLSISFPLYQIDIFHEGQKLSAPFKNIIDGKLWSGSIVTTGIINETLGIKFIWSILDQQSIGAMRYLHLIYILAFKTSLIILTYFISKNTLFHENFRLLFFLIISFISINLIDYNLNSGNFYSYRDLPIIICLISFLKYFENSTKLYYPLIIISFLSVFTFFWSIDRAIVINLLVFLMIIHILINKEFKKVLIILFSIFVFWSLSFMYFGNEFLLFIDNTSSIFQNHNYVHGIIHPQPFSDMSNSSRATKSFILIILSILISLSFLFYKKKNYNNNFKTILILLSFLSFCSYIYALGRSDGGHIKQTTGTLLIFFSILILFNLMKYFQDFSFKKKLGFKFSILISLFILLIFVYNLNINFQNITNYSKRLDQFVSLDDKEFLSVEQSYFVENIKPFAEKFNCVQVFTYDAALPYLIKKPNCSPYYFIFSMGSQQDQKRLIESLENVEFIIYSGQNDNWGFSPQKKLSQVDKYINSNFLNSKKILDWEIKYR